MGKLSPYTLPSSGAVAQPNPWPSRLGWALIVLGFLILALAGGEILRAITRGTHRVSLPGNHELKLRAGNYGAVLDPTEKKAAPAMNVTVEEPTAGYAVPVLMAPGGEGPGLPLFQFEVPDDGQYLLRGVVSPGEGPVKLVLFHESTANTRTNLVVGIVSCLLLGGLGLGVLIWDHRKKLKMEEELSSNSPTA